MESTGPVGYWCYLCPTDPHWSVAREQRRLRDSAAAGFLEAARQLMLIAGHLLCRIFALIRWIRTHTRMHTRLQSSRLSRADVPGGVSYFLSN